MKSSYGMFITMEDYENALHMFGEASGTICRIHPGVLLLTIPKLHWWDFSQHILRRQMLRVMHKQLPLGIKLIVKEFKRGK